MLRTMQGYVAYIPVHKCAHVPCVYMYMYTHSVCIQVYTFLCLWCGDTFWIEFFNYQLLTYIPKRVHFGGRIFKTRMDLALLDWVRATGSKVSFICTIYVSNQQNENMGHTATSTQEVVDLQRSDRRTPVRVLVIKTFHFADKVWMTYLQGMSDTR